MRTPRRAGVTLLELLAVMTILSILLGIGVGVLGRLNFSQYGAVGLVSSGIRNARESAIASGLPVAFVCDRKLRRMFDLSVRPIGHWQFEDSSEDRTTGAFGLQARLSGGARITPDGRMGGALSCAKGGFASAAVNDLASWTLAEGFSAECDVLSEGDAGGTLLKRGKQFRLALRPDGAVEAEISLAETTRGDSKGAGTLVAETPPGVFNPGRWTHVAVVYDRTALSIAVDGVGRAMREPPAGEAVLRDKSTFDIGDKSGAFRGRIDGVKVGAVVPEEGTPLPKDVNFAFAAPRAVVRFSGDGHLDPAFHRAPLSLSLEFPGGSKRDIVVGTFGTVRPVVAAK